MKSYRKYDWPALLKEFEQSGLTQAQFCLNKHINPKKRWGCHPLRLAYLSFVIEGVIS